MASSRVAILQLQCGRLFESAEGGAGNGPEPEMFSGQQNFLALGFKVYS